MANRYANIVGSRKISEDFETITTGFDRVQQDVDAANTDIYNANRRIDDTNNALAQQDERIDNIIAQSGDDNTEIVDARDGFAVLGERLNADKQEVLKILNSVMVASWHGVDSSLGTADATIALNNLFTKAKAEGKTVVYFDDPHEYKVAGDLVRARDLILIGDGARIKSNNLKNYFIRIAQKPHKELTKINNYGNVNFNTFAKAVMKKIVNVTIWGDSISTGGSDVLGIKYGNNNTGNSQLSPQGLTSADSYYTHLIDMLVSKFPDVTFNFYNRAIGGMMLQNSEDAVSFNGVSKVWSTHVKDTNPDLLIIAFGMNTNLEYSKTFAHSMNQITQKIQTDYTKKPSLAWVTTPRPTNAIDTSWGDIDSQISRFVVSNTTLLNGKNTGYVIDVGRQSDLKRSGMDVRESTLEFVDYSKIISGDYENVSGELVFKTNNQYMILDLLSDDYVVEFDFKAAANVTINDYLWIDYNSYSTYQNVLQIYGLLSASGGMRNYGRFFEGSSSPTQSYSAVNKWNDNAWRTVRIQKFGEFLDIFVNGMRVIRDTIFNNIPGAIRMRLVGNNEYRLKNVKVYVSNKVVYNPSLTERDVWGEFANSDYSTKLPTGGNGVNHPTTLGLSEVYLPALKEFVKDLVLLSKQSLLDLNIVPVTTNITTWYTAAVTTTTSGATLRYQNLPLVISNDVTSLVDSNMTRYKLRRDVKSYDDIGKLLANEFAIYESGGNTQIFMAYTGSLAASYNFTGYYES